MRKIGIALVVTLAVLAMMSPATAQDIKVLIVDGQNNHKWAAMTPFMKKQLLKTGLFKVDVSTSPPKGKKGPDIDAAWAAWRPAFKDYDVVVSNYNGQSWPKEVNEAFAAYVNGGGGVLIIHAANNAFRSWKEYDKMIGLGWRNNKHDKRLYVDNDGKTVIVPKGKGKGAGHGPQHEFPIIIRDSAHPITKGMPKTWRHAKDELYHGQRGPAADMQVLATAFSDKAKRGTGVHEPMLWIIPHGKGQVVTNVMGHENGQALQCVGFITIMNRSCEWLATGKVSTSIPANFPTADKVSKVAKE